MSRSWDPGPTQGTEITSEIGARPILQISFINKLQLCKNCWIWKKWMLYTVIQRSETRNALTIQRSKFDYFSLLSRPSSQSPAVCSLGPAICWPDMICRRGLAAYHRQHLRLDRHSSCYLQHLSISHLHWAGQHILETNISGSWIIKPRLLPFLLLLLYQDKACKKNMCGAAPQQIFIRIRYQIEVICNSITICFNECIMISFAALLFAANVGSCVMTWRVSVSRVSDLSLHRYASPMER